MLIRIFRFVASRAMYSFSSASGVMLSDRKRPSPSRTVTCSTVVSSTFSNSYVSSACPTGARAGTSLRHAPTQVCMSSNVNCPWIRSSLIGRPAVSTLVALRCRHSGLISYTRSTHVLGDCRGTTYARTCPAWPSMARILMSTRLVDSCMRYVASAKVPLAGSGIDREQIAALSFTSSRSNGTLEWMDTANMALGASRLSL
mmetsp:Transcript_45969/g.73578  ORF Transcript_45969/g.73578 Transcript_45969/m.73578 type:complete len:201 (-) Transcript_45969:540-1142(-)